ncbi:hypothetical protein MKZ87_07690 [Pseudomonas sp. MCal1]|uniref:hypothetical protein n=1 Tax=Pseudomonas sp. MCal1 TaxID=2919887 RepID=UPI00224EB756|nr:hypothetical protein [Pseudomonas sp. MCal1]MCX4217518.1 hypothetical protein [Pseudomonas sp. MCal1]
MSRFLSSAELHGVLGDLVKDPEMDLNGICVRLQLDLRDLLNQLALAMARFFSEGAWDFHDCDHVMNILFSDIVDLSMHADMPEPAFSIYLAFDAGEYWHRGDTKDECPWEKWTRPDIERILREVGSSAAATAIHQA